MANILGRSAPLNRDSFIFRKNVVNIKILRGHDIPKMSISFTGKGNMEMEMCRKFNAH